MKKEKKNIVRSTIYASDIDAFLKGENYRCYRMFGSRLVNYRGKKGAVFCVWAPEAKRVGVVGDFNQWDSRDHRMLGVKGTGIWWLFVEGVKEGDMYKYEVHTKEGKVVLKSDPYAFYSELRPHTASVVTDIYGKYRWSDMDWMNNRKNVNIYESAVNIYELHLGSWKVKENGAFYNYREIADQLSRYVREMGYTHVELLPVMEHPLDGSWGYQLTGYFSVTSRYGRPEDFMYFVDVMHRNNIGVVLDWVPGHFCKDGHGLYQFDGSWLYEYQDPVLRENWYWGTANFDVSKPEVQSFLISNALFWFDVYHVDGLRIDAVSNMLYLHQRKPRGRVEGDIEGEIRGFLQKLNRVVFEQVANPIMIAEESSAYPLVTHPTYAGGLGFNYKWNMGWMNDVLKYMQYTPEVRKNNRNLITFSLMYAFSENFILPFSHDEVVHGKKSLLGKMPGNYDQKFSNLRLLLGYMVCHPGKKLLFMGGELGHFIEWRYDGQLDWFLLDYPMHRKLHCYVKDLNRFYLDNKALWQADHKAEGFRWIDPDGNRQGVFLFIRYSKEKSDYIIAAFNFSDTQYTEYLIGVPELIHYQEVLNSDRSAYGGNDELNKGIIKAKPESWHGLPYCVQVRLPALSMLILKPVREIKREDVCDEERDYSCGAGGRTGQQVEVTDQQQC